MLQGVRVVALSINSHVMNRLNEIKSVIFRLVGYVNFRRIHFSRCFKVFIKQKSGKTTVKLVLSSHSKIDKTKLLKTNGSLMKVESIAECSILQYF